MIGPPELIRPAKGLLEAALPPLGLLPAGSLNLNELLALKQQQGVPVHVVFPVASPRESANLEQLLAKLRPLRENLVDEVWLAYGGKRPGSLTRLKESFPEIRIFTARHDLPPDQKDAPLGKGAVMRAFLYHLVVAARQTQPRTVVQFLDADIRPPYFHPGWVVDPVGAILSCRQVEAAKIVYHRPRGGRLNVMLRSLLALCPHPGVQALQKLVYLLSGEMAGTLHFWTNLPFKSGYGVEIRILLAFALNQLQLAPPTPDLEHLVQVYVGHMDHRHAPLSSSPGKKGLDQMAGQVFHTLKETLKEAGLLQCPGAAPGKPTLSIPVPAAVSSEVPTWLQVTLGDVTLPPLRSRPEVQRLLREPGR